MFNGLAVKDQLFCKNPGCWELVRIKDAESGFCNQRLTSGKCSHIEVSTIKKRLKRSRIETIPSTPSEAIGSIPSNRAASSSSSLQSIEIISVKYIDKTIGEMVRAIAAMEALRAQLVSNPPNVGD